MALMYERYGAAAPDIEEKPEWAEMQTLQEGWLTALEEMTASDREDLFEKIQLAITDVVGDSGEAVALDLESAHAIVKSAVGRVLHSEAREALAAGKLN